MNIIALKRACQAKLGIEVDGVDGLETWSSIFVALQCAGRIGTGGVETMDAVKRAVQARLNLNVDGDAGPETWTAIATALKALPRLVTADRSSIDWVSIGNDIKTNGRRFTEYFIRQVAVRGWRAGNSGDNRTDIYDDLIVVILGDRAQQWSAAVDPTTYLIRHPINPDGAAQLTPGLWLFRRGIHKGNLNWPCFVQAEDFVVNRLRPDGTVHKTDTGDFGIHEHSGGSADETQRFSAGCQIIQNPDGYWGKPWFDFYNPQVKAMKAQGQSVLPYLLINAENL